MWLTKLGICIGIVGIVISALSENITLLGINSAGTILNLIDYINHKKETP